MHRYLGVNLTLTPYLCMYLVNIRASMIYQSTRGIILLKKWHY